MGWLKWREALKPSGRYNRRQFLFWLFIPNICILLLLIANIWELEKLLIKFSYHAGFLGFDVDQICTFLSILLVALLIYMTVITMMRRCHDLGISSWFILTVLVPVLGLLFFVYLMFWAGKPPPGEVRTTHWVKKTLLSLAATVVSLTIIISSFYPGLYAILAIQDTISDIRSPWDIAPFRIWNQTDQLLYVQIIVRDSIVHQGYTAGKVSPNDLIKYENILIGRDEYTVKASNSEYEVVYSRDYTAEELAKLDWILVIPSF
jgi:uncharacterized membrane protein YhaH (DUF805 family)